MLRELQKFKYTCDVEADKLFGETRDYPSFKMHDVKKLFKHELAASPAFQAEYDKAKDFIDIKGTVNVPEKAAPEKAPDALKSAVPRHKDSAPAGKHRLSKIILTLRKNYASVGS